MQMNRTTDYAFRILIYLGQEKRIVPSSEMASRMRISQRYLLSIAQILKDCEYISVRFGPNGGYSIVKPLDKISMHDIVTLMEGSVVISRCLAQDNHCDEEPCVLHGTYSFLQDLMECFMRSLTVDMMIGQSTKGWQGFIMDKLNEAHLQYQCNGRAASQ